jgi:hypothetical protein
MQLEQDAAVVYKMQSSQGNEIEGPPAGQAMGTTMKIQRVSMIGLVLLAACSMSVSGGQVPVQQPIGPPPRQMPGMPKPGLTDPDESNPMDTNRAAQQEKMRNNDRQKRLVADTDKLLELATDLKAQVDKSTKDTLSVDVIKKADEIEKLAHSVKERMKG